MTTMTKTIPEIPFGKKTKGLYEDVKRMHGELTTARSTIADVMNDDGDLDKAVGKLGRARDREDLLGIRLHRADSALFEACVDDVRCLNVHAQEALVQGRDDERTARLHWREAVGVAHPKAAAERIVKDASLRPTALREARDSLDEARKLVNVVETMRGQVDKEWAEQYADTVAPAYDGSPRRRPMAWYQDNMRRILKEQLG
ncbi:MAG: hypothetical protein O2901_16900 [Verrucomicrobia bacterium]|nr:hypothetical protein [Verrucomicrobiota bacterium]